MIECVTQHALDHRSILLSVSNMKTVFMLETIDMAVTQKHISRAIFTVILEGTGLDGLDGRAGKHII